MNNPALLTVGVLRRTPEALDIDSFELAALDGSPLPAFSAGSHIDVHLPGGLVRQYSLCNDAAETHRYLIAVLRDPASRGGSAAMHQAVAEGQTLQISPPRNHFALAHDATRHLLLAGGIGVTPILCMAERLAGAAVVGGGQGRAAGADFELHYSTRSLARTAFASRIRDSAFASRVRFHFDDGDAGQQLDLPGLLGQPRAGEHVYVCGPKGYMDAVLGTARAAGWPEARLHFEFFGAAPVQASAGGGADTGFEVQIASSGRVIAVPPDKTVVQALAEVGTVVATSCEQGVCGTCLTRVLAGRIDHRDLYLTPDEQAAHDQFLPCCSRAQSGRLVLDL